MKTLIVLLFSALYVFLTVKTYGQQKVSFFSSDSLEITADLYLKNHNLPYIILFHQSKYSRGEYKEIADKLLKLDYNCLAVDMRVGDKVNFIRNETSIRAKEKNIPASFIECKKDIIAAIEYVKKRSRNPVILFGSSFSASLCLWVANDDPFVKAVIAFSPGEFFYPEIKIQEKISGLKKPIFVFSSSIEYSYISKMLSGIPEPYKTLIKPSKGYGTHGAKALWESTEESEEYWLELMLFFKKIKKS